MTDQQRTTLEIELRTQKNCVSLLCQAVPVESMEPPVRKFYEDKLTSIVALQGKLNHEKQTKTN